MTYLAVIILHSLQNVVNFEVGRGGLERAEFTFLSIFHAFRRKFIHFGGENDTLFAEVVTS